MQLARSTWYYCSVADDQAFLRTRIKELSQVRIGWGYRRIHILLQREGWQVNHKRVYRVYTQGRAGFKVETAETSCQFCETGGASAGREPEPFLVDGFYGRYAG